MFKVTLFSTPVSSELPSYKTTLLTKHLISPILFGLSKSGKKDVVLHSLCNPRYINCDVSNEGGFANYSPKLLLISEKWIYLQNYLKKFWISFALCLARLLIYNITKSD